MGSRYVDEKIGREEARKAAVPTSGDCTFIVHRVGRETQYTLDCRHAHTTLALNDRDEAEDGEVLGHLLFVHRTTYAQNAAETNEHSGICLCEPTGWFVERVGLREL